jgi:hypothetical protein
MPRSVLSYISPLIMGGILGVSFLYYFSTRMLPDENFDKLALGAVNTATLSSVDHVEVHCNDMHDAQRCISGYKNYGNKNHVVLWLGNSQLHSINQMEAGDKLSSYILHRDLKTEHKYLLTFSQPNASLQEHYLLFEYLAKNLPLTTLILAVVFDDMRETGIRENIIDALNDEGVSMTLEKSDVGRSIIVNRGDKDIAGNDMAALNDTMQKQSENYLNSKLEEVWSIWKERPTFRGNILGNLYLFRNWVFGLTPSSIRRMIPGRYSMNLKALKAMIHSANEQGINLLAYIVPIRNDVRIPYDLAQYTKFKSEIELIVSNGSAHFANLERIVPGKLWGSKNSTTLGGEQELDFMHFKAGGHRLLAKRIFSELKGVWREGKNDF